MKIFLILTVCTIIVLIGNGFSRQYSIKYKFYSSLCSLLEDIKLSISFKKEKIQMLINKYRDNRELKQLILAFDKYIDTGEIDLKNVKEIDFEDTEFLTEVIQNIGKYNATTELIQLDTFLESIKLKKYQAEENMKKYQPMVLKLSFLLSLAVGIVLIWGGIYGNYL